MDDRETVQRLVDGDQAGLAAAYDRYAQRLYDYCVGMLRDRDSAADAVHDALLIAADRAGQLRDPAKLRPWLYAIARNECHRLLRARKRETYLDEAGEVSDVSVELDRGLRAAEAQARVRAAVAGLKPGDREVLNLTLRHALPGEELGAALGVSANHANALASRARARLERAVGALVLDAAALFAAVALVAVPAGLRGRVVDSTPDLAEVNARSELDGHAAGSMACRREVGRRAQPFDRDGFPVPLAARRRRLLLPWIAAGLVVALLLGAGAALWRDVDPDQTATKVGRETTPSPTGEPAIPPPPSASTTPVARQTPASASPAVTITIAPGPPCASPTWNTDIVSTVTAGTPQIVTAAWQATTGANGRDTLRFVRGAWRGTLANMPSSVSITVQVEAVTADNGTGRSAPRTISKFPCPG